MANTKEAFKDMIGGLEERIKRLEREKEVIQRDLDVALDYKTTLELLLNQLMTERE